MKRKLFKSLMILATGLFMSNASFAVVHTITVSDFMFAPNTLTFPLGDEVNFVWGGGNHTTTSGSIPTGALPWDSPMNNTVGSFSYTPTKVGTYNYFCTPHQGMGMIGSFTVTAPTAVGNVAANVPFSVSPNPAATQVTIKGDARNMTVDAVDITGRIAARLIPLSVSSGERIYSVSGLGQGMYMLHIRTENAVSSQKLIIVR